MLNELPSITLVYANGEQIENRVYDEKKFSIVHLYDYFQADAVYFTETTLNGDVVHSDVIPKFSFEPNWVHFGTIYPYFNKHRIKEWLEEFDAYKITSERQPKMKYVFLLENLLDLEICRVAIMAGTFKDTPYLLRLSDVIDPKPDPYGYVAVEPEIEAEWIHINPKDAIPVLPAGILDLGMPEQKITREIIKQQCRGYKENKE